MIKYKKILLVLFILLVGCGYKPIFSSKETTFAINNIEFLTSNKINSKIKNQLKIYTKTDNKTKFYNLIINVKKEKNISLKDSKGDPKIFSMNVSIDVEVTENNISKGKRSFTENFSYNNNENKFDLNRYEENIENNILSKLNERIIIYLHSL